MIKINNYTMSGEKQITGNEPAMPSNGLITYGGLTIRQHFAAMAMQALLSDVEVQRWIQEDPRYDGDNFKNVVAVNSVEFADALIAELNK